MADPQQRYQPLVRLAAGGMATVYVGAAYGSLGFRQLVAIKRPHAHLLEDPGYRKELLAEARLASMLRHANVVDVRDIDASGNDVQLIMDYLEGASVGELLVAHAKRDTRMAVPVVIRIVMDALAGLQAAHDLRDERGHPVQLVHRDISPQNVLVGLDGVARVADFGVAKFDRDGAPSTTGDGLKGKVAYMAPEYLKGERIDRRVDVFATGVLLWEMLAGRRLFRGEHDADTLRKVLFDSPEVLDVPASLDAVLRMALAKDPEQRFQTAEAMSSALASVMIGENLYARQRSVADDVEALCGSALTLRRAKVQAALEDFLVASSIPHDRAAVLSATLPLAPPPLQDEPTRVDAHRARVLAQAPTVSTLPEAGHMATSTLPLAQPESAPLDTFVPPRRGFAHLLIGASVLGATLTAAWVFTRDKQAVPVPESEPFLESAASVAPSSTPTPTKQDAAAVPAEKPLSKPRLVHSARAKSDVPDNPYD
jgi:serine/threonine-protein kinase